MSGEEVTDKVWIPHPTEIWQVAEVIALEEDAKKQKVLTVEIEEDGKYSTKTIAEDKTMSYDKDHEEDFQNAFNMGDLNEPALLSLLNRRSQHDSIYTFTGDILLSVNPYKKIDKLYEPMPGPGELKSSEEDAKPHLYVLAERAYEALYASGVKGTSQSILVGGESGAGKTEAAKRIMAFLMELSQRKRAEMAKNGKKGRGGRKGPGGRGRPGPGGRRTPGGRNRGIGGFANKVRQSVGSSMNLMRRSTRRTTTADDDAPIGRDQSKIEKIILKTNPLLEAFGNARTIRNDNSSRFGKFVQLEYNQEESIQGARTKHFLLEKSRIVKHGRGERNYHIFYQMCAAFEQDSTDPVFADIQMLKPANQYKYLTATKTQAVELDKRPVRGGNKNKKKRDGVKLMADRAAEFIEKRGESLKVSDRKEYNETARALGDIMIDFDDKKNIWRVLTAILTLGNLNFEMKKVERLGQMVTECFVVDEENELETVAELLGVDKKLLHNALCKRTVKAGRRTSVTEVPLTVDEADKSRDGLAKAMYEALFEWMLVKINKATGAAVAALVSSGKQAKKSKKQLFIGILDIFGFEMLEDNSFEQLCINYANESLQGMFDTHVFELETQIYEAENISAVNLTFRDNLSLLEMLNKKPSGVFQLMDEQGALGNRGSDKGFLKALENTHKAASRFAGVDRDNNGKGYFSVKHFAGVVEYTATGMVEKNADHLQADLADLIALGGMPVEPEDLGEAEQKMSELQSRMQKTVAAPAPVSEETEKKEEEDNGNKFAFLQMILKLREQISNGAADDEEEKPAKKKGPKRKKMAKLQSVSLRFRRQMDSLQNILEETDKHFVRCIKPNDEKLPPQEKWDTNMVNAQLHMLGAFEMVRVRREGFPARSEFADMLAKYPELRTENKVDWELGVNDRQACAALMNAFDPEGKGKRWHLGDSKCFKREKLMNEMDDKERLIREEKADKAERIARRQRAREMEVKKRNAQVKMASVARMMIERKRYKQRIHAVVRFQANVRRKLARNELQKLHDSASVINAAAKGYLQRKRWKAGNKLVKFKAVVRGVLTRVHFQKVVEAREPFKALLKESEIIIISSPAMFESSAKLKRRNTTILTPHRLILTSGPVPRILFVNQKTGKVKTEIEWESNIISAIANNEYKMVIYSNPGGQNMRRFFNFQFTEPVAIKWLLALQNYYTIYDVLRMKPANAHDQEMIQHGNVSPLTPDLGYVFGGPTVPGGLDQVYKSGDGFINQLAKWRSRYFVLKGTAIYWFESKDSRFPMGGLSLNGLCTVSMGRAGNKKIYNKKQKPKQSLEIESPLLKASLKVNCLSDRERQKWVNRIKKAINRRKELVQRHSVTRGVINNKAFVFTEEMIEEMEEEEAKAEEDANIEDIEQEYFPALV